ncbi:chymotrypsin [Naegleria gruberi]|uniref:Chymotrypsin n=1 Tax=Naegleria gruberi TaxID=5762 RepID=D2V3N3_NAEGR|nr:chymotrypsin [Naegleria gruberi]EFC48667.1 chymotrypsin [Naegleria gruberi]|eukprot:XP_002681411.1 chymotrypsin [Naegleria gruberi]
MMIISCSCNLIIDRNPIITPGMPKVLADRLRYLESIKKAKGIKIANGSKAATNEFPFMVSLQYQASSSSVPYHFCGGSIINKRYIMTAAHCMFDDTNVKLTPSTIVVLAGVNYNTISTSSLSGNYAKGSSITVHTSFSSKTLANDIAIIYLDRDLTIDGTTTRLAYIESGSVPIPTASSKILVAGWGYTDSTEVASENLLKVNIPIVSDTICNSYPLSLDMAKPRQICAGDGAGHDSCSGDSGGPLFRVVNSNTKDFAVVGLVSYGPDGCGTGYETNRGVYTNTTYYLNSFIRSVVSSVQTDTYNSNSSYVYTGTSGGSTKSDASLGFDLKSFVFIVVMCLGMIFYAL